MKRVAVFLFVLIVLLSISLAVEHEFLIEERAKSRNVSTFGISVDRDNNKIEDELDNLITTELPDKKIRIIVSLTEPYEKGQLDLVKGYGNITHTFEYAINGFAAEVPIDRINEIKNRIPNIDLIEIDRPVFLHLDKSVQIVRARNITWQSYGFRGSNNFSIAVLDTGIDDSHLDLLGFQNLSFNSSVKIVGWKDTTADNILAPVDFNGHGSHVASTAAGTGSSFGNGTINEINTTFSGTLPRAGFCFVDKFEVKKAGTIKLNGTVSSGSFIMQLRNPSGTLIASDSSSPWFIQNTTNITGVWQAWACNPGGSSGRAFSIIETYPYQEVGDGFNLFTGVAPDNKLVGVKIFQGGSGSTASSELIEGMDWIIANKLTYRIKVASMSVGSSSTSISLRNAANNVVRNGTVFTISAGNDFPSATIGDPALAERVITVGATNDDDQMTDYSSNGPAGSGKPDVVAPGGSFNVKTQITAVDTNDNDASVVGFADRLANDYQNLIGTSMSTPHAGGAAALVVQALESTRYQWNYTEADALKVKMILLMTAMETNQNGEANNNPTLDRGGKDLVEGFGRINVDAAIEAVIFNHTIGSTDQEILNKTPTKKNVWARKVNLNSGTSYEFNLTVPSNVDFDLFLYNTSPDSIGNPIILDKSISATGNESIKFSPQLTGEYFLVVKDVNGSGQFNLTSRQITAELISITLEGFPVNFGSNNTGVENISALGNSNNSYKIKVNPETTINVDLYFRSDDFSAGNSILSIGNMSWNTANDVSTSKATNKTFASPAVALNVTAGSNITMYFWLDLPLDQTGGDYTAITSVRAVASGDAS